MMDVENVGEIGGEIRDIVVLRFEENPALVESLGFLGFAENVPIFEHYTESCSGHDRPCNNQSNKQRECVCDFRDDSCFKVFFLLWSCPS